MKSTLFVGSAPGAGSQARDMDEPVCQLCALRAVSGCLCSKRPAAEPEASRDERLARAERAPRHRRPE
jgi:hypothetical protein